MIEWIRKNAVSLQGVRAGAGFDDLAPLRQLIDKARVVALGEATHGTREFFQLKHRLLEFLVSELGYTLFMIEGMLPQSLAVNRYVVSGEGDAAHALASLRWWCWDCEEVLALIEWMRSWNAEHERKVYFYGYDIGPSAAAAMYLLAYLRVRESTTYRRLRPSLLALATDSDVYDWASRSNAEVESARAAVAEVIDTLAAMTAETAEEHRELEIARLHANIISHRVDGAVASRQPLHATARRESRDRAMADNVVKLLRMHGPDARALVWAHNGHIKLRSSANFPPRLPMGQHLREWLGDEYVCFGFAFGEGSFAAIDRNKTIRECRVRSIPGTLDATLAAAGPPVFALDLRAVPGEVQEWFMSTSTTRCIGGTYYPEEDDPLGDEFWEQLDFRALFDALLFVRETSAARSRPTASYMFEFGCDRPPAEAGFTNLDFSKVVEGWRLPPQPSRGAYQISVVPESGHRALEISRATSFWPWDVYALSQTAAAAPWRGKVITVRCAASMEVAHDGSSAQLAVRVLRKHPPRKYKEEIRAWAEKFVWQRVVTCDSHTRELAVTIRIDPEADTISLALVVTGDGLARFGPITIDIENGGE